MESTLSKKGTNSRTEDDPYQRDLTVRSVINSESMSPLAAASQKKSTSNYSKESASNITEYNEKKTYRSSINDEK